MSSERKRHSKGSDKSVKEPSETRTILFEWPLTNLKHHFDSSKSDTKSKVIKSVPFGGGRWTVLFYAQSGIDQFCSLYLNAEPLPQERSRLPSASNTDGGSSRDDRWSRQGTFGFTFRIETLDRSTVLGSKEAHDHAFSDRTSNWGWAQFAKRDSVFYLSPSTRNADAFLITVSITASPEKPSIQRPIGHVVPPVLVEAMGALLDDPYHSDIVFVLKAPRREPQHISPRPDRLVYGIRKILIARSEYFRDMFEGGFLEGGAIEDSEDEGEALRVSSRSSLSNDHTRSPERPISAASSAMYPRASLEVESEYEADLDAEAVDDSDDELEFLEYQEQMDRLAGRNDASRGRDAAQTISSDIDDDDEEEDEFVDEDEVMAVSRGDGGMSSMQALNDSKQSCTLPSAPCSEAVMREIEIQGLAESQAEETSSSPRGTRDEVATTLGAGAENSSKNKDTSSSHKFEQQPDSSSPVQSKSLGNSSPTMARQRQQKRPHSSTTDARQRADAWASGHKKRRTVPGTVIPHRRSVQMVRDSAYLTFKALLYYLYTDTIEFTPLTSSFLSSDIAADESSGGSGLSRQDRLRHGSTSTESLNEEMRKAHAKRKAMIEKYCATNPTKPSPCSAKAMYRLADKLQIPDLKRRAQEHIANSLTVKNIVWEVFSGFNSQYPDIRKMETDFLLKHWVEVKRSRAMKTIFFRASAHPGLAEVWPYLLSQLEYRATPDGSTDVLSSESD